MPGMLFIGVFVVDLATKVLATNHLGDGRVVELPLGARLEHGENAGIAFGLLSGSGGLVLILALVAILGLIAVLVRLRADTAVPFAVLLGGALANLVDRAGDGAVTDFIDLGPWPSFNLADVGITAGVALLAITVARDPGDGAPPGSSLLERR